MHWALKQVFVIPALALVAALPARSGPAACAASRSSATICAEQDNIDIPLFGGATIFTVEATHPGYAVGTDNCNPDFTNCPLSAGSGSPLTFKLFDDGQTVVEAVREPSWWLPDSMTVSVEGGTAVSQVHYVRLYRRILGAAEWPQFLVMYQDGNMRLIPQPPVGVRQVCFGASVVIGPTPAADRPFAAVSSMNYVPGSQTLQVVYKSGGSAAIRVLDVSRQTTKVAVDVSYPVSGAAFATFRSMMVAAENADTDAVRWGDVDGAAHDVPALDYQGGAGTDWFFYRRTASKHNPSAPDIRVTVAAATPLVYSGGVANAASFLGGPVSPGEAVSIFGCGMGPGSGASGQPGSNGVLSGVLSGARALFDGIPAPLWFAQTGQVNALVPYSTAGKAATELQVEYGSQRSPAMSIPVIAANPGIFTLDASGQGNGAILNQDSTVNAKGNPAARGSTVMIFATGEGQTDPPGVDGKTPAGTLPKPLLPVEVSIGGIAAFVAYAGAAPGYAGLMQVNARIPDTAPTGSQVPILISVGGRLSQPGVTIAIK